MIKRYLDIGLPLPIEAITNTFAIFGIRGSGKSNLGAVMAEQIMESGQPVCIIDPTGAWYGLKSSSDGKRPGFPVYVFGGEHADIPLEPTAGEVLANFVVQNRVPVVLDLKLMRKHEQIKFVMTFAETLFHKNREPLMVLIDEAARFAPQIVKDRSPEAARCLGAVEDLATLGRTRGLGVTLMAQRPAPVSTTLRTQVENLICLRTVGKHDRKAIDEWVEAKGTQKERDEMMKELAELPDGEGYFWSPGWLHKFEKVMFRRRTTFDSGATPKIGHKPVIPTAFAGIDKDKISEEIKATIARVEADDPKELRKKISILETTITGMGSVSRVGQKEIEAAHARGFEAACKSILEPVRWDELRDLIKRVAASYERLIDHSISIKLVPTVTTKLTVQSAAPPRQQPRDPGKFDGSKVGNSGLRRMMVALAQCVNGLPDNKLAVRALMSLSGTFTTYLSEARSQGWIEGDRKLLRITANGLDALGSYDPLPTGGDLAAYWKTKLPTGAVAMLSALLEYFPKEYTAAELAEASGMAMSGTFTTYLSKLRSLDLVTGSRSALKASDDLI